jgi:phosphotransferase system  glucose/maltose/N-acetylglucosamine-specific IIC component
MDALRIDGSSFVPVTTMLMMIFASRAFSETTVWRALTRTVNVLITLGISR